MIPELVLVAGLLLLIVVDLIAGKNKGIIAATGGAILLLVAIILTLSGRGDSGPYMFNALVQDGTTDFFRILFCLAGIVSLAMLSFRFPDEAEPHLLVLASLVGMNFLAGANDLVTLIVAIEMVSIPSYVLAGYQRNDEKSGEASLKYVLYGAVSSGIMLYGFSLIFGITGTTSLPGMAAVLATGIHDTVPHMIGVILILAGIGYKIAMVPFHFWCPDVYEGSPTSVTAYFSVVPKAAGFAALFRIMPIFTTLDPVAGISSVFLITFASALTMSWGNLGAIWQNSVKRLLAYSSIAHAGYLLMGFAVLAAYPEGDLNRLGTAAVMFYLIVYMFMNFGAFLVVDLIDRKFGGDDIKWFRGFGKTSPLPAVALSICLFSLVGLPPLAGFVGKFWLFAAMIKGKLFTLALIAIVNTVISLYYYVRIMRDMFIHDAEGELADQVSSGAQFQVLGGLLAFVTVLPTLILGIFWNQLATWIQHKVW